MEKPREGTGPGGLPNGPDPEPLEDPYDETLAESFPASDPPPSTLTI